MIGPRDALGAMQRSLSALRRAVVAEVEDIHRLLYHVLRGGLVVSLAFVLFAFVLSVGGGGPVPHNSLPPRDLLPDIESLTPTGLMGLGVLLLILTPLARVLLSLAAFAKEGDRTYVLVTAVVLANLLAGLLLGLG